MTVVLLWNTTVCCSVTIKSIAVPCTEGVSVHVCLCAFGCGPHSNGRICLYKCLYKNLIVYLMDASF